MANETLQNPYVGPRAFEVKESRFFFGRAEETEILSALVQAQRAALFFAQSGAGKSSLLRAGLIPNLTRRRKVGTGRHIRRVQKMRVLPILTVGKGIPARLSRPLDNIFVFSALLGLLPAAEPDNLAALSLSDGLTQFFDTVARSTDQPDLPHLLIFDQFEEIFISHPHRWPEREIFFQQVARTLADFNHRNLRVLLTMREDYLAELTPYAHLLPESLRPRFRLERLKRDVALQAITQPAEAAGRTFAQGVAEELVDNLRRVQVKQKTTDRLPSATNQNENPETPEQQTDEPLLPTPYSLLPSLGAYIEPVHLQIVCRDLWEKLPPDQTTIEPDDVAEFGDVDQALISFYENALQKVLALSSPPSPPLGLSLHISQVS